MQNLKTISKKLDQLLGAVHLSHDTRRGRGGVRQNITLYHGGGGVSEYITLKRDEEIK